MIAGIINAIGVTLFIAPVQLYDSGISGTSILLSQLTPDYLSLSFFLILLNIPLLLFGFKRQGAVVLDLRHLHGLRLLGGGLAHHRCAAHRRQHCSPLAGTDLFLCALFGGIISGVGSGLAIRYGGAMDGIEVVAVIFATARAVRRYICADLQRAAVHNLWHRHGQLDTAALLHRHLRGGLQDRRLHRGRLDSAKAAMIITTHPDEIARAVSEEFGTGLTIIDAHGFYSDTPKTVLYVVVNRFQTVKLKTLVKGVDANAYMAISPVADLLHGSKEEETA